MPEKRVSVSRVPPESVGYVWPKILPMIEKALKHGEGDSTTSEHVLSGIVNGKLILWAIHKGPEIIAGLVLSVRTYPAKTTLVIEFAAGRDLDSWIEQIEHLLREFRDLISADTIECSCRAGLAHRLGKRGWKRKSIIMELK